MKQESRQPGWDKQAINQIARDEYGGLDAMFEAHGWTTNGRVISQIAPTKVVQTYGSVDSFVKAHADGQALNPILNVEAAFKTDPPQVFLKSFHGFTPENWGFLGFTEAFARDKFVRESKPGALLIVAGTSKAPDPSERLRVLGMQQQTHIHGTKWDYLAPARHEEERNDPDRVNGWIHGLKAIRAWKIPLEERPFVRDIFPETHNGGKNGTAIGAYGMQITFQEAQRFLKLPIFETDIYGGLPVEALMPGPAETVLKPSRPGPVSQSGYMVREAEGPKHLYILRLHGDEDSFLGYGAQGRSIVKVGFSVSPQTRRAAHNKALPACAFGWHIENSTYAEKRDPFPSSNHAIAGENAMKDLLCQEGKSLGGEFFLADQPSIKRAWQAAVKAAENWKP
ncbi:hypothetical protein GCM10023115_05360 [Pontixanthobacter gangjinensis]|uniref:Uncharacterized protein n=1 Tax=Pontixanthobacter gangjinensis TaxID=1028742 RepID=A0A6I4SKU4_9SPHN|nr:hypothetical protein [Pontixanthobacter gangjinensis]MXO55786.1 hypothetical protein [Pontixanthobacter gangjinensis]